MAIKPVDLFITFLMPVMLFITGYAEYLGYIANAEYLEYGVVITYVVGIVLYLYKTSPSFLFTSGMTFYYYIGMCVSLLFVNSGTLMIEIDEYGTANGATLFMLAIFSYSVGISKLSFSFAANKYSVLKIPRIPDKVVSIALCMVLSLVLILGLFILIVYSGPVLSGMNRVAFWESIQATGLSFYPTLVIQTFYFLIYYYLFKTKVEHKIILATFLLIGYLLVTIFVLGQKFSAFIIFITTLFTLLPSFVKNLKIKKQTFIFMMVLMFLIITIISLSYVQQGYNPDFIITRIALQGQVMWSIINYQFPDVISNNSSCLIACEGFKNVSDYISFHLLPLPAYLHYSATDTNLTGFSPAVQLMAIGLFPTLILQSLVYLMLGYVQAKIVIYNRERNFVMGFLLFKISLSIFLIWHAVMFTAIKGMFATFVLLIVYVLIAQSFNRNQGRHSGRKQSTFKCE